MFDTMTITKAVGAFCGALLVFLLGNWAAAAIFHVGPSGHGAEGEVQQAYYIDTNEGGGATEEAAPVDFATLIANADVANGEKLFKKCQACHKLEDGANATGPTLYHVVGRPVQSISSFGGYSGALAKAAEVWTPENLFAYLEDPKAFAPGNKMAFAGFKKPEDRADVIAFLESTEK